MQNLNQFHDAGFHVQGTIINVIEEATKDTLCVNRGLPGGFPERGETAKYIARGADCTYNYSICVKCKNMDF